MLHRTRYNALLLCGAAVIGLSALSSAARAEEKRDFSIEPQPLATALMQFGNQSGATVVVPGELTVSRTTRGVSASLEPELALQAMLDGTGLTYRREGDLFAIVQEGGSSPQDESAAGDGAEVEALIVTAQKREENIQDVPIAISAFSQKDLEAQKIEGGPDLMRGVPNLTFSKSNFTSYNLSIRGIGTKAISASTDPGVAVSFNNLGFITNRFFEQEFFDVERVEVLRGPQGTLYGRNATGGVVNIISAKPKLSRFEASLKGELGNYDARRAVGMVNIPVIEDVLAIRLAGAYTQRTGYDYNSLTQNNVNGRDLWSGRLTIGFEPFARVRGNLIWEHFEEDDNRSRTGKQLCHRDDSPAMLGSTPTDELPPGTNFPEIFQRQLAQKAAFFSQGCKAGSLYDDAAYGTPNGLALGYVAGTNVANSNYVLDFDPVTGAGGFLLNLTDPYGGLAQSRDLREISSIRDPIYRAKSDILELSLDIDLTESLSLSWQAAWNKDEVYSFQDYNRFNTVPVFTDTSRFTRSSSNLSPGMWVDLAPGGVFCDPQIGCSDRLAVFDISSADSEQFTQELRLQSDFDGPFDFSIGANYTRFETQNDYYVMSNLLTAIAMMGPFNGTVDQTSCTVDRWFTIAVTAPPVPIENSFCPYIDPNPVESINGQGHNYFRSSNPYELESWAGFGEAYYNVTPDLKVTAGLRYTHDRKTFTPVPSQLLLSPTLLGGGYVGTGYPERPDIKLKWGEFTGRLGVDWKPELGFTDDTLVYAFYSRGYKAGGVNPPTPGFATVQDLLDYELVDQATIDIFVAQGGLPRLELTAVNYGPTFEPEFVDAFEIGSKNMLQGGGLTLNGNAFFYDYAGYQVSQIRDRTAVNENFDAKIWGAELSALFQPIDNLRLNANLGYLDTRIGEGERSIDPMNRTHGNPDYVIVKPFVQLPSNCVVPVGVAEEWFLTRSTLGTIAVVCGGLNGLYGRNFANQVVDPATGQFYDESNYPEINDGAGFYTDLSDNELPNAPHWTVNIGGEYGRDILDGSWRVTLRGDAYWQSQSWARTYNLDPYDKLHGWYNLNVSVRVASEDLGLEGEFYVKNLLDKSPITDAFLNSDDSGLTTNIFVLDPRLIGVSVRKTF